MSNNENKLDKVLDKVNEIEITLVRNTTSLEEHIRRTNLLEAHVDDITETLNERTDKLALTLVKELKPLKAHVAFVKGATWALGIAGSLLFALSEMGILAKLFGTH